MSLPTPTLADFLLARLTDDEAEIAAGFDFATLDSSGWMGHAATWGRDRALAECDAKRRIVELHRTENEQHWVHELDGPDCQETENSCVICGWFPPGSACDTVRLLALAYADHPDYREEWKP